MTEKQAETKAPPPKYNAFLGVKMGLRNRDGDGYIGMPVLAALTQAAAERVGANPGTYMSQQVKRMLTFAAAHMPADYMLAPPEEGGQLEDLQRLLDPPARRGPHRPVA